jgi:hypothetical protein
MDQAAPDLGLREIERAACEVVLRKLQPGQRHLVVVGRERPLLEKLLGFFHGLGGIVGEHALVEDLRRRERRPIPEHHIEKLEALDMSAEHDQADGQGRGENEPNRTPQRGPECRRGDHRHR